MSRSITVLLLALFSLLAASPARPQRGPSTPEERKRFLALVHKLEEAPLDPSLNSEIAWALQWLDDIPDVTVTICFAPLGNLPNEQYRYGSRVRGQFVLAMGAFLLQHPGKARDFPATYLAGVESALRVYRAILKDKRAPRSPALDHLLSKQNNGELADFVGEASKDCRDQGNQSASAAPLAVPRPSANSDRAWP